jgi:hypothetical protein
MVYELMLSLYFPTDLSKTQRNASYKGNGHLFIPTTQGSPNLSRAHFLSWEFLKHKSNRERGLN